MKPELLRKITFCVDGLRYTLSMAEIAASRLESTLDDVARAYDSHKATEMLVSSALLDAWTLIDMCHRARGFVESTPTLPGKFPGIQTFLDATVLVKDQRNYVQHLRGEVSSIPDAWSPLWGALAWLPTFDRTHCYSIIPGSPISGTSAPSVAFDTDLGCYCDEIILYTGVATTDLRVMATNMRELRISLNMWLGQHPVFQRGDFPTMIFKETFHVTKSEGSTPQSIAESVHFSTVAPGTPKPA